jgi:TRAP transporter TAXI family solute receptor
LGTGSQGGASYQIGTVLSSYLQTNDLTDTVNLTPVATGGTTATYRKVAAKDVEIGGSTTQLFRDSPASGPFEGQPVPNWDKIRQVRAYFLPFEFFVAKKGSGINTLNDLEGEPVYISSTGSGSRPIVEKVIDMTVGMDNIQPVYSAWGDVPKLLRNGRVKAATVFNALPTVPTSFVQELDSTVDWKPVALPSSVKRHFKDSKAFQYMDVDASQFASSYKETIDGYAWGYVYTTLSEYDSDIVYELTKLSYEHGEDLKEQNKMLGMFPDPDGTLGSMHEDVPVHQGAYEFYKEKGLWKDYDLTAPPEA